MNTLYKQLLNAKNIIALLEQENPTYGLWNSIAAQLEFIAQDFDSLGNFKHSADEQRVKDIILGVQAIREIDASQPDFADLLCEIDYQYKKLYNIG